MKPFILALIVSGILGGACAASQQVAEEAQPVITQACNIANDIPAGAPYLDLICVGVEAADAVLEQYPRATIVGPVSSSTSDAGSVGVAFRVRLPVHTLGALDAGGRDAGGQ